MSVYAAKKRLLQKLQQEDAVTKYRLLEEGEQIQAGDESLDEARKLSATHTAFTNTVAWTRLLNRREGMMERLAEGNEECQNSKCEFYDETAWQRCGGDLAGEPAIASCLNWAAPVTMKPEEWKNGAADFACYLINNCERETITEEFIQQALVDFAKEAVRG